MKKFLGIVVLGLLLISSPANAGVIGSGELKLSPSATNAFIKYVQTRDKPRLFLVPIDGSSASYWYCPAGVQCVPGGAAQEIKKCERYHKKDCAVFAKGRRIRWRNGINENNKFIFKSKMTGTEIEAKLTELGFLGETTSTTTKIKKKESKIKKKSEKKVNGDVVQELKELKQLYDDGVLTKEEFDKAKKKVLN